MIRLRLGKWLHFSREIVPSVLLNSTYRLMERVIYLQIFKYKKTFIKYSCMLQTEWEKSKLPKTCKLCKTVHQDDFGDIGCITSKQEETEYLDYMAKTYNQSKDF